MLRTCLPAVFTVGFCLVGCGAASAVIDDDSLPAICSLDSSPEGPPDSDRVTGHPPVLISGGTVMTAAGDVFEVGYVLLEEGRITAVGDGALGSAPNEATVIDATGRFVTPGLIDAHSHLGVYPSPYVSAHSDGNEATNPTTAHVQAVHSVWPQDPNFLRAIAGGVTSLQILPGSANLIGGRSVTVKIHRGARAPEDMRFPGAPDGLKMACGENPKMVYGGRGSSPSTRMASIAMMRQAWLEAERYRERWTEYEESLVSWCDEGGATEDEPDSPERNLGHETLAAVLDGDVLAQIHCYRADEMLVQLELAEEFGYQVRSFHHAVEAYKIRDVLAEQEVATCTWADWWGFKIEAFDSIEQNAGLVTEAGARAIIHSDSAIGIQRLNQEAAKAYYRAVDSGISLTDDDALRWITENPAWVLGVDDQTGSLTVGKMADVVVWSAHPFSVYAQADLVFVDGVLEYDRVNSGDPWSDFELGLWPSEAGR